MPFRLTAYTTVMSCNFIKIKDYFLSCFLSQFLHGLISLVVVVVLGVACSSQGRITTGGSSTRDELDGNPDNRPDDDPRNQEDPVPSGLVPAFVAVGYQGRRAVSCDGGESWIYDQNDTDVRCDDIGQGACDHGTGAAMGIGVQQGRWAAVYGWGQDPGAVLQTTSAESWTRHPLETTYGGIAFGNGQWILGKREVWQWDSAGGRVAGEAVATGLETQHVRHFVSVMLNQEHVFVQVGNTGNEGDLALGSGLNGGSWTAPEAPSVAGTAHPPAWYCATNGSRVAGHGTHLAVIGFGERASYPAEGNSTLLCLSHDGGQSWSQRSLPNTQRSTALISDGTRFFHWAQGALYTSVDGEVWAMQAIDSATGEEPRNNVAYGHGRFATIGEAYEEQYALWSADGVQWRVASIPAGHAMRHLAFGYIEASEECPEGLWP